MPMSCASTSFTALARSQHRALREVLAVGTLLSLALLGSGARGDLLPRAAPVQATPAQATPITATQHGALLPLPPAGWWVPTTLKLPKAAEGRVAWRFTLREVITIDGKGKLERRASDMVADKPGTFKAQTPVPMTVEYDEKQQMLTVTLLKPKVAFFTLSPAGEADVKKYDNLVIDVHAPVEQKNETCIKAQRCARIADMVSTLPAEKDQTLTTCTEALNTIRQEIASRRRPIPSMCR